MREGCRNFVTQGVITTSKGPYNERAGKLVNNLRFSCMADNKRVIFKQFEGENYTIQDSFLGEGGGADELGFYSLLL